MPAKTILSVVGVDHGEADLLAAAEVAQEAEAHLAAVVVGCVPPPPVTTFAGEPYSAYAVAWEEEYARVAQKAKDLSEKLAQHGYAGDVQPIYALIGNVADEIAQRATYADLTLLGDVLAKDEDLLKLVLDGALFASPSPVVLGGKKKTTLAPKKMLIAWNGKREAAVAVRHAIELLTMAEDVHVVIIDPEAAAQAMGEEPGADIATWLARHGIKITVDVLASGGRDPALVLQRHALDIGADLIVMGAYGRTRLRERIFGGTTQTMLSNVDTPVFMAR